MIQLSYSDFKTTVLGKNLTWQYTADTDHYNIFAVDSGVNYSTIIYLPGAAVGPEIDMTAEASNQSDFETNYKPYANQPIAQALFPFAVGTVRFAGDSAAIAFIAPGSLSFNMDYRVDPTLYPRGLYITGGELVLFNSAFGDYISAQVVDNDNVLGDGAGLVLDTYINRWYTQVPINDKSTTTMEIETNYAALIYPGLYLRLSYTSTGGVTVGVAVNYDLHQPLI
jgi:hypothetical protein